MAVAVTCSKVIRRAGKVYVRWTDKTELEFESLQQVRDFIRDNVSKDSLRAIALAKLLEVSPDGSNAAALEGKTVTLDLSLAANLVRIT